MNICLSFLFMFSMMYHIGKSTKTDERHTEDMNINEYINISKTFFFLKTLNL